MLPINSTNCNFFLPLIPRRSHICIAFGMSTMKQCSLTINDMERVKENLIKSKTGRFDRAIKKEEEEEKGEERRKVN